VELHPLRRGDAAEWSRLRVANEAWLSPWEPSHAMPWRDRHTPPAYRAMRRSVLQRARMGTSLPFAIRVEGRLAGQVTIDNIVRVLRSRFQDKLPTDLRERLDRYSQDELDEIVERSATSASAEEALPEPAGTNLDR